MQAHKMLYTTPQKPFIQPYDVIIYRCIAFAAGSVFYFCFYYRFIMQAAIISFMTFSAVPAFVTDFNMTVMH